MKICRVVQFTFKALYFTYLEIVTGSSTLVSAKAFAGAGKVLIISSYHNIL